jgi:hypothetical protein
MMVLNLALAREAESRKHFQVLEQEMRICNGIQVASQHICQSANLENMRTFNGIQKESGARNNVLLRSYKQVCLLSAN